MKKQGNYKLYIDISGTIKGTNDDIYIGCILFNDNFRVAFREKFYRNFPSLKSFKRKGSLVHPDKLKEIIKFMQDQHLKMTVTVLKRHVIQRAERRIKEKLKTAKRLQGEVHIKSFEERLMGLAYFNAVSQHAWQREPYDCIFCIESQFQIQDAFVALMRVAHPRGFWLKPACTARRVEHMLKFADFVASAGRKLDKFVLDQYSGIKYQLYEPTDDELDVAFCISRREFSKSKNL